MKKLFLNIKNSFQLSLKGQESMKNIIFWWGILAYFFFYFVVKKIIRIINIKFFTIILSIFAVIYFSWHIFVLKKNEPKKPKISKEEKAQMRKEKVKNLPKSLMRKLLLQEPITKWNTVNVLIALDLLYILTFLDFIIN